MVFQTKIFKMDGVLYRSPKGSGKSYVKSNKNVTYTSKLMARMTFWLWDNFHFYWT